MYYYAVDAIDCGWDFLPTVESFLKPMREARDLCNEKELRGEKLSRADVFPFVTLGELERDMETALEGVQRLYQGYPPCCKNPRMFFIPMGDSFAYGVAWKHDNDVDMTLASPIPLPIQEDRCWARVEDGEGEGSIRKVDPLKMELRGIKIRLTRIENVMDGEDMSGSEKSE